MPVRKNRLFAVLLRILLGAHAAMMSAGSIFGLRKREVGAEGCDILLTGTFYSANWILSHLKPLALSKAFRSVRIVTTFPIPPLDKVEAIHPRPWLVRIFGTVPARLVTFILTAFRCRPHVVGGFHLLLNGLTASLLARFCGARSIYFCVGGPAEVQEGGIHSENRLFVRLRAPDRGIENMLLRSVAGFDLIVTMGNGARDYFRERGVRGDIRVISGGIDGARFGTNGSCPSWDVVFVGRLAPIKQIDILLRSLAIVHRETPGLKAVIVGDGPLRKDLETLSTELGLRDVVEFAGQLGEVSSILSRSKVFVLTSKTEGLSLALMEAMMAGVPAVVPDVGDLGDLVQDGENGFLVGSPTPENFAERIATLLNDPWLREKFGRGAKAIMDKRKTECVAGQWDTILASWRNGGEQEMTEVSERCG